MFEYEKHIFDNENQVIRDLQSLCKIENSIFVAGEIAILSLLHSDNSGQLFK